MIILDSLLSSSSLLMPSSLPDGGEDSMMQSLSRMQRSPDAMSGPRLCLRVPVGGSVKMRGGTIGGEWGRDGEYDDVRYVLRRTPPTRRRNHQPYFQPTIQSIFHRLVLTKGQASATSPAEIQTGICYAMENSIECAREVEGLDLC